MQMETAFAVPFQKRDDETFYNYCLSFSPAAPFFGVPWRFASLVSVTTDVAETPVTEAVAPSIEAAVETLEAAVEVMAAGISARAKLVAEPAADAPAIEAPVELPAEAPVEAAVETVAEAVVEDVQADLLGAASAAPAGLFAEAPAVIDDLKLIKGVGPKLEVELNGLGIYTFAQIAAMTEPQLIWLDEQISSVRGRPMRDDWAGQSKALAG
jgi:predicted flap endonuclease-1-like 5' DNA nuclease